MQKNIAILVHCETRWMFLDKQTQQAPISLPGRETEREREEGANISL